MDDKRIFTAILMLFLFFGCMNYSKNETPVLRILDGFIIEENNSPKTFYLQENEGGQLVELKFLNEDLTNLNFDEFGHVEVIGLYNANYHFLVVDQITNTN